MRRQRRVEWSRVVWGRSCRIEMIDGVGRRSELCLEGMFSAIVREIVRVSERMK
jgi:hypothetical protein